MEIEHDLPALIRQPSLTVSPRHQQIIEDWVKTCAFACLVKEKKDTMAIFANPPDRNNDSIKLLQTCGHLVYSKANRNAIAYTWRGKHISTISWERGVYAISDEPSFTIAEPGILFPADNYYI